MFIQVYCANHNDDSVLLLAFPHSWFVAALIVLRNSNLKVEFEAKPLSSARGQQGAAHCGPPLSIHSLPILI
jgi:hypothetical protein